MPEPEAEAIRKQLVEARRKLAEMVNEGADAKEIQKQKEKANALGEAWLAKRGGGAS